jgi:hypothetical protein
MGLPIFIVAARRLLSRDPETKRRRKRAPRKKSERRAKRSH